MCYWRHWSGDHENPLHLLIRKINAPFTSIGKWIIWFRLKVIVLCDGFWDGYTSRTWRNCWQMMASICIIFLAGGQTFLDFDRNAWLFLTNLSNQCPGLKGALLGILSWFSPFMLEKHRPFLTFSCARRSSNYVREGTPGCWSSW